MVFSARLKGLLEEKGVTWKEVSEELSIGKNSQKYWEDKEIAPDGKTLIKLCQYFNVSSDYLLGIDTLKEKSLLVFDKSEIILTDDEKWFVLKLRELDKEGRVTVENTLVLENRRIKKNVNTATAI